MMLERRRTLKRTRMMLTPVRKRRRTPKRTRMMLTPVKPIRQYNRRLHPKRLNLQRRRQKKREKVLITTLAFKMNPTKTKRSWMMNQMGRDIHLVAEIAMI